MALRRSVVFAVLALSIFAYQCESAQVKDSANTGDSENVEGNKGPKNRHDEFLSTLKQNYPAHENLTASFRIKGVRNNKNFFLIGKLVTAVKDGGRSISIKLQDGVFSTLVYSLNIENDVVSITDHMNKHSETTSLEDFYLVEIFGSYFPFQFLLPFMYGSIPEVLYTKAAKLNLEEQKISLQGNSFLFTAAVNNSIVSNIEYKDYLSGTVTSIDISNKLKNHRNYYFPGLMKVTNSVNKEYIIIQFTRVYFTKM